MSGRSAADEAEGPARRAAVELPGSLMVAARIEQLHLWSDLSREMRAAMNGVWSLACDSLVHRIVNLAGLVGATPWDEIQVSVLRSGVYERVLSAAGIGHRPVDWARVAQVEAAIAASAGAVRR